MKNVFVKAAISAIVLVAFQLAVHASPWSGGQDALGVGLAALVLSAALAFLLEFFYVKNYKAWPLIIAFFSALDFFAIPYMVGESPSFPGDLSMMAILISADLMFIIFGAGIAMLLNYAFQRTDKKNHNLESF